MKCINHQPLNDEQISDALDGVAEVFVMQHLAQCDSCRMQYSQAKQLEDTLQDQLYRWDCPPPETLVDYHLGALDHLSTYSVKEHLRFCSHCKEELVSLRDFLGDDAAASVTFGTGLIEQFEVLWTSPIQGKAEPVRGGASEQPIIHRATDGTQVILDVRERHGRPTLYGQIIDAEGKSWQSGLVEIRQNDALIAATTVDDLDNFFAPFPSAAPMQIRITRADGKVIILRNLQLSADDQSGA